MTTEISNVYVYKNHMDAENAVRSLGLSGFEMKHLSIVGRGYHTEEHPLGFYSKGDRIRSWHMLEALAKLRPQSVSSP